ncbi:MAG: hypothetical protein WCJ58_04985 [bacterium]
MNNENSQLLDLYALLQELSKQSCKVIEPYDPKRIQLVITDSGLDFYKEINRKPAKRKSPQKRKIIKKPSLATK